MKTDWVAEVFAAMRDCGENIAIVYGSQHEGAQPWPRWIELQHDQFDGMSGLALVLRKQGLSVDTMPTLKGDRLTFMRGLRGLVAVLPTLKVRPRTWNRFDGTQQAGSRRVDERLAWKLFSEDETLAIIDAAKAEGVTANTYLLYHLDAAVARRLTQVASARLWMIPVNLRGAVKRHNEQAPHMAFLGVGIDGRTSLTGLQTQITRLKTQGCHWGAWILLHAGRLVGTKGLRTDLMNREKKQHGWTGIFSNLGAWNVVGGESWIFGPAISRVHPVGAGCLTMNGRMALTIQLHDAFGCDLSVSQALLDDWTSAALQAAPPAKAVPTPLSSTPQQVASYG